MQRARQWRICSCISKSRATAKAGLEKCLGAHRTRRFGVGINGKIRASESETGLDCRYVSSSAQPAAHSVEHPRCRPKRHEAVQKPIPSNLRRRRSAILPLKKVMPTQQFQQSRGKQGKGGKVSHKGAARSPGCLPLLGGLEQNQNPKDTKKSHPKRAPGCLGCRP